MELSVSGLACARGGVAVLEGVTFALRAGQAMVLRGPNGAGKTTLLRTLAGLQSALAGTVSLPPASAAYAGHADGVKAALTVRENVAFWAAVHGHGGVDRALVTMGLAGLPDRRAQHLSAGQKRRLGLARLQVAARPLWLLDEPTVSLDAASVALFAEVLRAHLAGGGIALVASHAALGLAGAAELDLAAFRARATGRDGGFGEAFG